MSRCSLQTRRALHARQVRAQCFVFVLSSLRCVCVCVPAFVHARVCVYVALGSNRAVVLLCVGADCGNRQCEFGEACTTPACDTVGCKADCPVVQRLCPSALNSASVSASCAGNGRCQRASGACESPLRRVVWCCAALRFAVVCRGVLWCAVVCRGVPWCAVVCCIVSLDTPSLCLRLLQIVLPRRRVLPRIHWRGVLRVRA
jgi:hypothetical protein